MAPSHEGSLFTHLGDLRGRHRRHRDLGELRQDNVFQVEYAFLLAGPDGLLDRVEDHGGGHRGSDPPAQDPASVGVGDKGHVGEPCPGRHIGEVCYPQPGCAVWCLWAPGPADRPTGLAGAAPPRFGGQLPGRRCAVWCLWAPGPADRPTGLAGAAPPRFGGQLPGLRRSPDRNPSGVNAIAAAAINHSASGVRRLRSAPLRRSPDRNPSGVNAIAAAAINHSASGVRRLRSAQGRVSRGGAGRVGRAWSRIRCGRPLVMPRSRRICQGRVSRGGAGRVGRAWSRIRCGRPLVMPRSRRICLHRPTCLGEDGKPVRLTMVPTASVCLGWLPSLPSLHRPTCLGEDGKPVRLTMVPTASVCLGWLPSLPWRFGHAQRGGSAGIEVHSPQGPRWPGAIWNSILAWRFGHAQRGGSAGIEVHSPQGPRWPGAIWNSISRPAASITYL